VCYAPVLDMDEAAQHPHNKARETITEAFGVMQPNVAPRFGGTPSEIQGPPPKIGEHNETALAKWGFSTDEIAALKKVGAF
ncbi:MAG: CoA transferase, partial [Parvibaculales bacterium]